jgi:uncharacterized tellurite resistance protein B-like protein
MFISKLNMDQQSALLALAERIAAADGVSHDEEVLLMASLRAQSQQGVEAANIELNYLSDLFDSEASKSALMLELLGIAFSDSDYHESEKILIKEVADSLDIEPELLADMESWVSRQMMLIQEANGFMGEV